ncbi:MAG TPA: hypothetical protein DCK99_03205 [Blastocatellia bacterium]|nr:hypothetical protein [Blastocatellia bacterium]
MDYCEHSRLAKELTQTAALRKLLRLCVQSPTFRLLFPDADKLKLELSTAPKPFALRAHVA